MQKLIAHLMPQGVVHHLEVVQVQVNQGDVALEASGTLRCPGQFLVEVDAVGQAGDLIVISGREVFGARPFPQFVVQVGGLLLQGIQHVVEGPRQIGNFLGACETGPLVQVRPARKLTSQGSEVRDGSGQPLPALARAARMATMARRVPGPPDCPTG